MPAFCLIRQVCASAHGKGGPRTREPPVNQRLQTEQRIYSLRGARALALSFLLVATFFFFFCFVIPLKCAGHW